MGQQVTGIVTGQCARITLQSLKQTLIPPVYTQWYMLMLPYQTIFSFLFKSRFLPLNRINIYLFFEQPFQTQPPRYCYCAYRLKASLLDEELKQRLAPEQNDFSAPLVLFREREGETGVNEFDFYLMILLTTKC